MNSTKSVQCNMKFKNVTSKTHKKNVVHQSKHASNKKEHMKSNFVKYSNDEDMKINHMVFLMILIMNS